MSEMPTDEEMAAFKASPEYQALGVVGRDRLLRVTFPAIDAAIKQSAAKRLLRFKPGGPDV